MRRNWRLTVYLGAPAAVVLSVLAASVPAPGAFADDGGAEDDAKLKPAVERRLRELGSNSRDERLQAEQALLKLGPKILPFLPAPELTSDVSVREAVRRVRERLERQAALDSVKPSTVSLAGEHSLEAILRAVAKQTGNAITFDDLPAEVRRRTLKVEFQSAPFWAVVADVSKRGRVAFVSNADGTALNVSLRNAESTAEPAAVKTDSAFRVAVKSVEWKPLFGDDGHRLLRIGWSVTAEPRLRPLFLKYAAKDAEAVVKSKTLEAFDPAAQYEVAADSGAAPLDLHTDFRVPATSKFSELRFRGKVSALTAAAEEPVAFRGLENGKAAGTAKRRGGVTVAVRDVQSGAEETSIAISVSYDVGGPAFESHRTWIFHNRAYLQTADGKRIPRLPGFKTNQQRDGAVGITYSFRTGNVDAKTTEFVYVAPTLLIDVPVAFDFEKLPVPEPPERKTP